MGCLGRGGLRVHHGGGCSVSPVVVLCLVSVHARSPPLSIVRRFIHLLQQSQQDFWEESEVLRLQEEVVKRIRANRQLESDLDLMDIKIGLLVKNRITLQVGEHREDLGHLMLQSWSFPPWHHSLGWWKGWGALR